MLHDTGYFKGAHLERLVDDMSAGGTITRLFFGWCWCFRVFLEHLAKVARSTDFAALRLPRKALRPFC